MIKFDDIESAGLSDVGMRRSHNQDSYSIVPATDAEQWRLRGHVYLVADGMGAHAVGELASKLAADNIPHIYQKHAGEGPPVALRKAFVEANSSIHNRGQANREFEGMGTTGTALVIRPEGAWVGHVGDSRVYRVRNNRIEQLSFDHSLLWELARRQKKDPDQLEGVPSNVIVRSLGPEPLVEADVEGPHPLQPGDVFLLCSDGLSGPLNDREIGAIVSSLPPEQACRFLIHLANLQGGPDNITAVVARVKGKPPAQEDPDSVADVDLIGPRDRYWLLKKIPWSLVGIFLGIVFAVIAIYLTTFELGYELAVFLLSALCLLGGMVGLIVQYSRDARPRTKDKPKPLRVYRRTDCAIDESYVQRISLATATLENRLKENGWTLTDDKHRTHLERARQAERQKKFREAFREYCMCMHYYMDVIELHRTKEEAFTPLFDRASNHKSSSTFPS